VIISKNDNVHMQCTTDGYAGFNTITWNHDAARITTLPCTTVDASRFNATSPTHNDCFILGLANDVSGNQGPYTCSDGSSLDAQAVAILIGTYCI